MRRRWRCVVGVVVACVAWDIAGAQMGGVAHLPAVLVDFGTIAPRQGASVAPLEARYGFGWPGQEADVSRLVGGLPEDAWWFYDWSPRCSAANQIPMVRRGVTAGLWDCNDGRDVLIANEPDGNGGADQDNMAPCEVADLVHGVAPFWIGRVWCCGTYAQHLDYMLSVIGCYEDRYGPWEAAVYGWHVHGYSNGAAWSEDNHTPERVAIGVRYVTETADALAADGHAFQDHILLSEYGVLSWWSEDLGVGWHRPEQMPAVWQAYERELAKEPRIAHLAWFSAAYARYSVSDLVRADGSLHPVGEAWRASLGQWRE